MSDVRCSYQMSDVSRQELVVLGCQWSVVSGQWSVVGGQWSVVGGQLSVVSGQLFRLVKVDLLRRMVQLTTDD